MQPQDIFVIIWFIGAIVLLGLFLSAMKKAKRMFPEVHDKSRIQFKEESVSGCSHKDLMSRIGVKNILKVVIIDDELWIYGPWLSSLTLKQFDVLHKVELNNILNAEKLKDKVIISFLNNKKERTILELQMLKHEEFLQILNQKIKSIN